MKVSILVVPVDGPPRVESIEEGDLKAMQAIVGGYIERVWLDRGLAIYCNEEGLLKGLEPNLAYARVAAGEYRNRIPPSIVGNLFIAREEPPNIVSLTDADVARLTKLFS